MSKPHLRALELALGRKGWQVVAVQPGDERRMSGTWELQRITSEPSLFLDFHGLDRDGNCCLPLEASYGCQLRDHPTISLYFRHVNKSGSLWDQELMAFVKSLDDCSRVEGR